MKQQPSGINLAHEIAQRLASTVNVSGWHPVRLSNQAEPRLALAEVERWKTNPEAFMRDVLGVKNVWEGQVEIMQALAANRKVVVRSGHALGKDFIGARLILWFLLTHAPSIVIATGPTSRQVEKVVWGELEDAYFHAKRQLPGRLLSKELVIDEYRRWYAIGFTTKDVRKQPGRLQGYHQNNILVLFTEAQAIDQPIWDQAESLMTAPNPKWLAIGNPLVNFGPFFEASQPNSGWFPVRLNCEDSPNVRENRIVIPGLCSREWVEMMAAKYRRNSATFISKVGGEFPPTATGSFISADWITWASHHGIESAKTGPKIVGVDVAGHGRDKTVVAIREGMRMTELRKFETAEEKNTAALADYLIGLLTKEGVSRICLDVTGVGTGVYDTLIDRGYGTRVSPVNFGGKPTDDAIGDLKNRDKFSDMATQMYHGMARLLEQRQVGLLFDPDLHMQLVSRRMHTRADGRLKLEAKDDYKMRGYDSPDEADATVLCFSGIEPHDVPKASWVEVDEDDGGVAGLWAR